MRLDRPSRTPSPTPSTPTQSEYYGTSHLHYRSRSPSPSSVRSLPIVQRRPGGGRRLPPTPTKPSTLRLDIISSDPINFPDVSHSPTVPQPNRSPGSINFPKLSASPTHTSLINSQQHPPWRERTAGHSLSVEAPNIGHHMKEPAHLVHSMLKPDGNYSTFTSASTSHGHSFKSQTILYEKINVSAIFNLGYEKMINSSSNSKFTNGILKKIIKFKMLKKNN